MKKITAIVNQKGGTGKTTTVLNLGSALSILGKKVMLIDLDPHAGLTYAVGIINPEFTIADVFAGLKTLKEILIEKECMYIAPSSTELADIELYLKDRPGRENYLLKNLAECSAKFDYILIDSPPSISILMLNALKAADELVVPMPLEVLSLEGLNGFMKTVGDCRSAFKKALPIKGIIAVRYDSRLKLSKEILDYIKNNIDQNLFETKIRYNVRVAESPSHAQSVIHYAPSSNGAKDYMAFAKEFLKTK
ncbi:MAG: ParA family protein [Nitrospira sp.]|nr:ParA family protein [Nitrospira sp.]